MVKIPKEIPEWLTLANPRGWLNTRDMRALFGCSDNGLKHLGITPQRIGNNTYFRSRNMCPLVTRSKMRLMYPVAEVIKLINQHNDKDKSDV